MDTVVKITRQQIVSEARRWLGTPFHHQGRLIGVGVDCSGLVVGVMRALQIAVCDSTTYSRQPDGTSMVAALDAQGQRIPVEEVRPGDVLLFWIHRPDRPQHLAIVTDRGMIHAHAGLNERVVEHAISDHWRKRICGAYRIPGVVEEES